MSEMSKVNLQAMGYEEYHEFVNPRSLEPEYMKGWLKARKDDLSGPDEVYLVKKNADMTEGRGPMIVDSVWGNEEEAWAYANQQLGVMGRKPFYVNPVTGHVGTGWNDEKAWPTGGDWTVETMTLRSESASQAPQEPMLDGTWVVRITNTGDNTYHSDVLLAVEKGLKDKGITYAKLVVSYEDPDDEMECACGKSHPGCTGEVKRYEDGFSRGMCEHCSTIRCDLPRGD